MCHFFRNVAEPVRGRATNNTAEIQAATYALELAQAAGVYVSKNLEQTINSCVRLLDIS